MKQNCLIIVLFYVNYCACKPLNIILILADDLGWNDVSFHGGNQIQTPNIDSLAYNGATFNNFFTQATCTPSRAALLTGQYPMRFGFQGYPMKGGETRHIPENLTTLPERLKKLGYKNHLIGKWHLGYSCQRFTPVGRGFDSHFGYWNGYVGYYDYTMTQNNMTGFDFHNNYEPFHGVKNKYAIDVFTEKSIEIIKEHDKESPLFLMLAHLAPHTGENGTELPVKNLTDVNLKFGFIDDDLRRRYADIVEKLDESVGKIVSTLSAEGLLQDSAIFFLSDNGGQTVGPHENRASNWPLKGLKFTLLNGGIRVPSILYTPTLKEKGIIIDDYVHITDLFKTIYSAAGGASSELANLDSQDIWENVINQKKLERNEVLLDIDEVLNNSGIISGKYKLIEGTFEKGVLDLRTGDRGRGFSNPEYNVTGVLNSAVNLAINKIAKPSFLTTEKILSLRNRLDLDQISFVATEFNCSNVCLFDLENDPLESKNLAHIFPDIVENLRGRIEYYRGFLEKQSQRDVDLTANPKYFDDTWSPWLQNTEFCK